jgi:hypothetical protein
MSYKKTIIKLFITILTLFAVSCTSKKTTKDKNTINLEYKIIKIDSINKVYLIYAKENESFYKILSLKVSNKLSTAKKIKLNNKYKLNLTSLDVPMYVDGLDFYGEPIQIERDSIYDLHTVSNLKGLYFIK